MNVFFINEITVEHIYIYTPKYLHDINVQHNLITRYLVVYFDTSDFGWLQIRRNVSLFTSLCNGPKTTHNRSQSQFVERETVDFVFAQAVDDHRLQSFLDGVLSVYRDQRPHLLDNLNDRRGWGLREGRVRGTYERNGRSSWPRYLIEPFGAVHVGEEHPGRQFGHVGDDQVLFVRDRRQLRAPAFAPSVLTPPVAYHRHAGHQRQQHPRADGGYTPIAARVHHGRGGQAQRNVRDGAERRRVVLFLRKRRRRRRAVLLDVRHIVRRSFVRSIGHHGPCTTTRRGKMSLRRGPLTVASSVTGVVLVRERGTTDVETAVE